MAGIRGKQRDPSRRQSPRPSPAQRFEDRLVRDAIEEDAPQEFRILDLSVADLLGDVRWEIIDRELKRFKRR